MSKQLVSGKHRLRNTYWSLVGAASATILSVQPVMAETIWDRFSTIMRDIYGQLVGISTIVAVTVAAVDRRRAVHRLMINSSGSVRR